MAALHTKFLATSLLAGILLAGCDGSASPDATAASRPSVINSTSSTPVEPVTSGSAPANQPGVPLRPEGPIPGTVAGSIAQTWAQRYHAKIYSHAVPGGQRRDVKIDFPEAHATLEMDAGNQGADSAPADGISCVVRDPSLPPADFITMSHRAVEQLVADCPGPALQGDEAKRIIDFVAGHDRPDQSVPCSLPGVSGHCRWSDHRLDMSRFRVAVVTSPRIITLTLAGRKS